jgi:hypothetical protein
VIARLEDAVIFRGLVPPGIPGPQGIVGLPDIWNIHGGQESPGLWSGIWAQQVPLRPSPPGGGTGDALVETVSDAIGRVEAGCHLGPFALVLDPKFFLAVQTPSPSLVLPQDRIIPFLGGGPLLRSSTLPENSGVLVALGGASVELVVAQDLAIQFLQVTDDPHYLFRVCEKIALRIKEAGAIANLTPP